MASDALFVTLDPLLRRVRLPDRRELLVSDTVGFIDRLPHALVAAFRATLEEVPQADLVLHVIDAASRRTRAPHARGAARPRGGRRGRRPRRIDVYNKVDALSCRRAAPARVSARPGGAAVISARTGEGARRAAADDGIAAGSRYASDYHYLRCEAQGIRPRADRAPLPVCPRRQPRGRANGRVVIEADVPSRYIERLTTPVAGTGRTASENDW
jgi:hypothetical protein